MTEFEQIGWLTEFEQSSGMYKYLPSDQAKLKNTVEHGASLMFFKRTAGVLDIVKW